jgi:tetratricopeptide (TPR) repeat protein
LILLARKLSPESADLRHDCAQYLGQLLIGGIAGEQRAWFIALNETLLEEDPLNVRVAKNLIKIHILEGDLCRAKEYADRLLERAPQDHLAHSAIGLFYLKSGQVQEANEKLLTLIELENFEIDFMLAQGLLDIGQRAGVIRYLSTSRKAWKRGQITLFCWIVLIWLGFKPRLKPHLGF